MNRRFQRIALPQKFTVTIVYLHSARRLVHYIERTVDPRYSSNRMFLRLAIGVCKPRRCGNRRCRPTQIPDARSDKGSRQEYAVGWKCGGHDGWRSEFAVGRDCETSHQVRVLTGNVTLAGAVKGKVKRVQNALADIICHELAQKLVFRFRAFIAEDIVLRPVGIGYVQTVPYQLNAAKLVQDDSVDIFENGRADSFPLFVICMNIVLLRVFLGLSAVKCDEQ